MGDAPERIWATEDTANFGEDRFHSTTPMRGLTEYLRADIATTREADLRAEVERLQAANREAAMQSLSDLGQAQEALDRAMKAEAEAARLRALLDEVKDDLEAIAKFTPVYDYVQGAKLDEPGSPFDRGRQRAYGEMQVRVRAILAKIGGTDD